MADRKTGHLFYQYDHNEEDSASLIRRLVYFATEFGLEGNIWQHWLTYQLMTDENPFSLACERLRIREDSTLMKLAMPDLAEIRHLMHEMPGGCSGADEMLAMMADYHSPYCSAAFTAPGKRITELSARLADAESDEGFCRLIAGEYEKYGTGIFGLYRAFRVSSGSGGRAEIVPVAEATDVTFDELIGYESQKEILRANTEAFVSGEQANNVLLYGDSGTGKSTSIHALMHDYFDRGLRLVEIDKQHRSLLPQVLAQVKKRNYHFIIFLDDLSFEENESDYKELKAMLEGALESREDRVLIYATSNRRHLIRETWGDRSDMEYKEDIHRSDTMEEKLSLASRFGVTIYYAKPGPEEYMSIVRALAERRGIELTGKALEDEARKWELRHGGMSGRTASQFITWLQGQESQK